MDRFVAQLFLGLFLGPTGGKGPARRFGIVELHRMDEILECRLQRLDLILRTDQLDEPELISLFERYDGAQKKLHIVEARPRFFRDWLIHLADRFPHRLQRNAHEQIREESSQRKNDVEPT